MIVIVVPLKDGKFLMVRNPKRGWEFPGGKVERGETPREAAMRECLEEAGAKLKNVWEIKRSEQMIVFAAEIEEIKGGEMKAKLFEELPENLSYPEEEAREFLNLAGFQNLYRKHSHI